MNRTASQKNAVAPKPPMGWNSWDCYAATVNETQLMANAAYMRTHLAAYGWAYVVCDIQWSDPLAGTEAQEYRPFAALTMDEYGRLLPAENRFPSSAGGAGFAPVAARIHDMGLKFGIHIMRGIPRQAVHARTPVKGTAFTAEMIASPFSICKWNGDMYGVDADKPGAQAWYDSLFELYAAWGVDFVKVDDICNTNLYKENPYSAKREIELIRRAIDRCGRPMVLSLSPGPAVIEEAWHLAENANMWRMTDDFWDSWPLLVNMFTRCEVWQRHVGPGCWPDCDMLPLGRIGMGHRHPRGTAFTRPEQVTMMTLWCIFRSPLMMGGEMNENDDWTLALLTNEEVLRVNQEGNGAWQVARDAGHAVWASHGSGGELHVALFNLADTPAFLTIPLAELDLPADVHVRDLWKRMDLENGAATVPLAVEPHGARLLTLR